MGTWIASGLSLRRRQCSFELVVVVVVVVVCIVV